MEKMTIKEIMEYLGVSKTRVYILLEKGQITQERESVENYKSNRKGAGRPRKYYY